MKLEVNWIVAAIRQLEASAKSARKESQSSMLSLRLNSPWIDQCPPSSATNFS